jgi:hypothetical protein
MPPSGVAPDPPIRAAENAVANAFEADLDTAPGPGKRPVCLGSSFEALRQSDVFFRVAKRSVECSSPRVGGAGVERHAGEPLTACPFLRFGHQPPSDAATLEVPGDGEFPDVCVDVASEVASR